jgi:hypothetical protein
MHAIGIDPGHRADAAALQPDPAPRAPRGYNLPPAARSFARVADPLAGSRDGRRRRAPRQDKPKRCGPLQSLQQPAAECRTIDPAPLGTGARPLRSILISVRSGTSALRRSKSKSGVRLSPSRVGSVPQHVTLRQRPRPTDRSRSDTAPAAPAKALLDLCACGTVQKIAPKHGFNDRRACGMAALATRHAPRRAAGGRPSSIRVDTRSEVLRSW